jgi:hypothetical protein
MANPELQALPDIVVVDASHGKKTGTTNISYVAGSFLGAHRTLLWERFGAGPWNLITLVPRRPLSH